VVVGGGAVGVVTVGTVGTVGVVTDGVVTGGSDFSPQPSPARPSANATSPVAMARRRVEVGVITAGP
jgi:hypothetical protein